MSISPLVEPDDLADAPRHKPWNTLGAVGWSVACGVVMTVFAALGLLPGALRGDPPLGILAPSQKSVAGGAGIALAVAVFVSAARRFPLRTSVVLAVLAGAVGAACGLSRADTLELVHSRNRLPPALPLHRPRRRLRLFAPPPRRTA